MTERAFERKLREAQRESDSLRAELQAARERCAELYHRSPLGYATVDAEGRVVEANRTLAGWLGQEPGGLAGQLFSDWIVSEDRPAYHAHGPQGFGSARADALGEEGGARAKSGPESVCEVRLNRPGQDPFWVRLQTSVARESREPQVFHTLQDIREWQRREEACRLNETRFRAMNDELPALICEYLPDSTLTYVNRAYAEYFGVPAEELIGRRFLDFVPKELHDGIRAKYLSLTPNRPLLVYEHEVITQGEIRVQEWYDRAFFDSQGRLAMCRCVANDITDRKRAEQLLREQSEILEMRVRERTAQLEQESEQRQRALQALEKSEAYNLALLQAIPDLILILDREGYFRDSCSGADIPILMPPEEFLDRHLNNVLPPPQALMLQDALNRLFDEGRNQHFEYSLEIQGSVYWFEACLTRLGNDQAVLLAHDFTERRRVQEQVETERRRLANALEGSKAGAWETNLLTGEMIVDDRWAQILGFTRDEIQPVTMAWTHSRLHPEDLPTSRKLLNEHMRGERDCYDHEVRVQHKQGHWLWSHLRGRIVRWGPDGTPQWMYGTQIDINERKQREEQLGQQTGLIRSLLHSIPDLIFFKTVEGVYLGCNAEFARHAGRPEAEIIGKTDYDLYSKAEADAFRKHDHLMLASGTTRQNDEWIGYPDGRRVLLNTIKSPLVGGSGELVGILGISRDITDRHAAQRELEEANKELERSIERTSQAIEVAQVANEAKSRFVTTMSHEIRTPLNAVLGFSRLLTEDSGLAPHQAESVRTIADSAEHLHAIVNSILDYAKIESGRLELNEQDFSLEHWLASLDRVHRFHAQRKGLQFDVQRQPGLPNQVRGDRTKLYQIFANLLYNAIKFTETGSVTLRVGLEPARAASGCEAETIWLVAEVADTGCGIGAESLDRLFEPFYQGEGSAKKLGSGLGLAISRGFAQLLGGEITVRSEVERGSCFKIRLPLKPAEGCLEGEDVSLRRVVGLEASEKPCRILVVDDIDHNRALLRCLLEPVGFEVREAEDGRQALEVWREWNPQAVLMDMRMPVMNGFEATRQLKEQSGGQSPIVIAVTGFAFEQDQEEILALGIEGYLRKPLLQEELFAVLKKTLGLQYRYADPQASGFVSELSRAESSARIRALPPDLVSAMASSVEDGDMRLMKELIGQVASRDAALAKVLHNLADEFEYTQLGELLEREDEAAHDGT